jgi:hypothetical protein
VVSALNFALKTAQWMSGCRAYSLQPTGPSVSNLNARDQTGAINLKIFPQKQVELIQLVFN